MQQREVGTVASKTRRTPSSNVSSKHESFVYVRVRPVLESEKSCVLDGDEMERNPADSLLTDLVTETSFPDSPNDGSAPTRTVAALNGPNSIRGFNGILGIGENNLSVFQHTVLPRLETVLKGGTSSLFCYGYTGSGKTHTIFGYNSELGLFHLAAEDMFRKISEINKRNLNNGHKESESKEPLMMLASVVEIYNGEVFDVLGGKTKISLRNDCNGKLVFRGATTKKVSTEEEMRANGGVDYSVVTESLSAVKVESLETLDDIYRTVMEHRAVGTSTEHCQSSRSHAVFRLEIVNQALLDAVNELEDAETLVPALKIGIETGSYHLVKRLREVEKKVTDMNALITRMYESEATKSAFGGRLILVDLAGADSDSRSIGEKGQTLSQRHESTAINSSILALKQCIRGLQSSPSQRYRSILFRNSTLTRLLEEVLTPKENRDSNSVMLVNVAPTNQLKSKTIDSLKYGQEYSTDPNKHKQVLKTSNVRENKSCEEENEGETKTNRTFL